MAKITIHGESWVSHVNDLQNREYKTYNNKYLKKMFNLWKKCKLKQ